MMIFIVVFCLGFIGLGIYMQSKKAYWLISGYNNIPESERQLIEIDKIAGIFSYYFIIYGTVSLVSSLILQALWFRAYAESVPWMLLMITIPFVIIFTARYDQRSYVKYTVRFLIFFFLVLYFILGFMFYSGLKENTVVLSDTALTIQGSGHTRVNLALVKDVSVLNHLPVIRNKKIGFSFLNAHKGRFILKNGQTVRLVISDDRNPILFIHMKAGEDVYLNFKDRQTVYDLKGYVQTILDNNNDGS